eukprot:COSAG04_NODE_18333_length_445_cov_0.890173_1_plen_105_part_01
MFFVVPVVAGDNAQCTVIIATWLAQAAAARVVSLFANPALETVSAQPNSDEPSGPAGSCSSYHSLPSGLYERRPCAVQGVHAQVESPLAHGWPRVGAEPGKHRQT